MNLINSEMPKLSDLFEANKLSLNIQKPNCITFKPGQRRDEFTFNIEMNGLKNNQVSWCYFRWVIVMETPYFSGCEFLSY